MSFHFQSVLLRAQTNKRTHKQTHKRTREREKSRARDKPTWTDDIFNTIELSINAALLSYKLLPREEKGRGQKKKNSKTLNKKILVDFSRSLLQS